MKARRFLLVERERIGENAYRVNAGLTTLDGEPLSAQTGFEQMRKEIALYPARYAPVAGTHTLVLLADDRPVDPYESYEVRQRIAAGELGVPVAGGAR
ncbi:MAG TPA: hypothetical protein VGM93_10235 [Acidimicrobiales bacterium]